MRLANSIVCIATSLMERYVNPGLSTSSEHVASNAHTQSTHSKWGKATSRHTRLLISRLLVWYDASWIVPSSHASSRTSALTFLSAVDSEEKSKSREVVAEAVDV
jgi:hypothetical protein